MSGMVRGVDRTGRLCVPREALDAIGVEVGDYVEIWLGQDEEGGPAIALTKRQDRCIFCSETSGLTFYQDKALCSECHSSLIKEFGE